MTRCVAQLPSRNFIYLCLRLLHLQVRRVGQEISRQFHRQPASLIAVAMSVEGLSTCKQNLHRQEKKYKYLSLLDLHKILLFIGDVA